MAIKRCISRACLVEAGFHPRNPRGFRQIRNIAGDVGPRLRAVARHLEVSVIGSYPDGLAIPRRLADRVDRCMHLGVRIVDRNTAGFFLLLFLRIVGGEIRRDALPRLTVIAGTEEELRADVNRALLIGANMDRSVPVEAQFPLSIVWLRLDQPALQREPIDSPNKAAL